MICKDCTKEFRPYKGKPGFINQCTDCGQNCEAESGMERLGGNMVYLHKTGATIEIKPMSKALEFAARTKRLGAGVTASITQSKAAAEREVHGEGTEWNGTTLSGHNK